jgi:hypothetical protein
MPSRGIVTIRCSLDVPWLLLGYFHPCLVKYDHIRKGVPVEDILLRNSTSVLGPEEVFS